MHYSLFVSADEVDAGWMRHSEREVIERPGDFRLWHFSDLTASSCDVGSSEQGGLRGDGHQYAQGQEQS
jgi:hypothetical protein